MGLAGSAFKDVGKEFPKGTILFKEGDEGKEMFLINSGEVKLSRKTSQGDVVLAKLGFGEFFGEMSVITNEPRTVTAESITDCRLNVITKDVLETLVAGKPLVALSILKKLMFRLESAYDLIEDLYVKHIKLDKEK
ncbi:MAG: cyclic nucleotide-binding domain-containing protein [Candidatus Scalindua sp.]|jgi:CRP-like cAMP-binding protein|nr:cyclic nucleotide-binding domain-containing protein [Candidatus Scalindua sp.]MBT5303879.1 cyclic nucleotide-binding domain-containing protein [Candidatus Scalindua sp.]MBT6228174.1 cyclic nucleotide-binding domain-containing protein [Candidatus Scalindua sp.]MBT6560930.1 cyclic nucleotide-binding domain-containing protein [Candidatus Scalindua sp.]MBT7210180.1 cyclic nucleotide-binding domain-containing protein [Candidatus Scalindua sp.]